MAISSTLKFLFTENHESSRFYCSVRQKIGDLGPIKLRTIFPHTSVLSKLPQLPYLGSSNQVFVVPGPAPRASGSPGLGRPLAMSHEPPLASLGHEP